MILKDLGCIKIKIFLFKIHENIFKFEINNILLYYQNLIIKKNFILIFDKIAIHINNNTFTYL